MKQKYTVMKHGLFACFILFIVGCGDKMVPPEPMHYPITLSFDHMPFDVFTQYSKAVFINQYGDQKSFDLEINESIHQVGPNLDDTTNKIELTYNEKLESEILFELAFMAIETSHYFSEDQEIEEYITCISGRSFNSINQPGQFHYNPQVENQEYLQFLDTVELRYMEFENIYTVLESDVVPLKTLYYSTELGIVGFSTISEGDFALLRFEE